ncbi:hypothetical protein, partial [Erwinia amylovora]|uniref:hypothetical protein n=1 Tax=Erwinia amylovora TaxID=552 RepID=UPI001965E3AA
MTKADRGMGAVHCPMRFITQHLSLRHDVWRDAFSRSCSPVKTVFQRTASPLTTGNEPGANDDAGQNG